MRDQHTAMRLFVALRPPPAIREALLQLARGSVDRARWQNDAQLHLTLAFLGDVAEREAELLHDALGAIAFAPFDLALASVGRFERQAGGALYAAVAPSEMLSDLASRVAHAVRRAGLAVERRRFVPHVTIARMSRQSGSSEAWLAANRNFTAPPWSVRDFRLYASQLHPDGARYDELARYDASLPRRS